MNKYALLIVALFFAACHNGQKPPVKLQPANIPGPEKSKPPVASTQNITDEIPGTYTAAEGCDMQVTIQKTSTGYTYNLNHKGNVSKGKATLTKGDNPGEQYINFEGIKWAEYEGDISNEDSKADTTELVPPVGVTGLLSHNEIVIQNSGNSMNYYVIFSGCDEKYIRLIKNK